MRSTVKVAAGQFAVANTVQANLDRIAELTHRAATSGAELIVFPEASTINWYGSGDQIASTAARHGELIEHQLAQFAARESIVIVAGTFVVENGHTHNRMLTFGDDGSLIAAYDKVHLYDSFGYRESDKVTAGAPTPDGTELSVFSLGSFTVGLLNCYDVRFPEISRLLIDAGVDLFVVSSGWTAGDHKVDHWLTLLKARAIENTCYVVAANQAPPESVGESCVINPIGDVLSQFSGVEGLALADINFDCLTRVRKLVPSLEHRKYTVVPNRPSN